MTSINRSSYPILFDYTILAQTGITFGSGGNTVNGTYYGCANGNISGDTPGGNATVNNTSSTISMANTQLTSLVTDINNLTLPTFAIPPVIFTPLTLYPNIIYTSSYIASPGTTVTFNANNDPNAQFFIVSDDYINFSNSSFIPTNGTQAQNIFWLAKTGSITLMSNISEVYGNFISSSVVTYNQNAVTFGNIFSQTNMVNFIGPVEINGNPVCYLKGTKILTEFGYVAIENLSIGDKVVTKGEIHESGYIDSDNEVVLKPIVWIGNFTAPNLDNKTLPICIKANALGENMPFEDLYVSPGHRILLDNKMVLSTDLINGETIFQDMNMISVEYYHIELESHFSVIANGVLSESYLHFDGHGIFNHRQIIHKNCIVSQNAIKA